MREILIVLVASLFAGIVIMILHEFPKAFLYQLLDKTQKSIEDQTLEQKSQLPAQKIWKLHQYIDPIGLLFCGILHIGFSKPYYYRIKDKKVSRILGITGLLSLLLQFLISTSILRFGFGLNSKLIISAKSSFAFEFLIYFLSCYAIIGIGMLLTNLFPIVAFDMGLLVAAASPIKFFTIIRADYLIKMVWLFTVLLGLMNAVSSTIFGLFMG